MKKLILVLGDQLDFNSAALRHFDPSTHEVMMIESRHESTYVWSHKAKIALFLSAMRHFAKALESQNIPVTYIKDAEANIVDVLKQHILHNQVTHLACIEPGEYRLKIAIEYLARDLNIDCLLYTSDAADE